jgi:hypothetical protein
MKLTVSIPTAEAYRPLPASVYLADFRSIEFNNAELGLRHPVGIYNVSIGAVAAAFKDAIDAAIEYRDAERDSANEKACAAKLVQSLDHLLDATTEHFDGAKSIVRVMFDEKGDKSWKKALADLNSLVKTARDFPARQANEIKHKQARIRLIRADAPAIAVVGYFIDGVDADGAVGPSPYVHRGNTAFSLGRAFRTLACGTYFLSRALLTLLSGKPPSPKTLAEAGLGQLAPVFEQLLGMDRWVFWDEPRFCPAIVRRGESIVIDTNAGGWIVPPAGTRINFIHAGDGVTRTFRVPYMGDYLNPAVNAAPYRRPDAGA